MHTRLTLEGWRAAKHVVIATGIVLGIGALVRGYAMSQAPLGSPDRRTSRPAKSAPRNQYEIFSDKRFHSNYTWPATRPAGQ